MKVIVSFLIFFLFKSPVGVPGKIPVKGIIGEVIVISYLVGNGIAWMSGAYPKDFPVIDYSPENSQAVADYRNLLEENPDDPEVLLELGMIYADHNRLDDAEKSLEKATEKAPGNQRARAYLASVRTKIAGASWDFTFGLYELSKLKSAIEELNTAQEKAPDDALVRVVHASTLASVGPRTASFDKIKEDESWWKSGGENRPAEMAPFFNLSFANYYAKKAEDANDEANNAANKKIATDYLDAIPMEKLPYTFAPTYKKIRNTLEK